jgi:hypothetical protein
MPNIITLFATGAFSLHPMVNRNDNRRRERADFTFTMIGEYFLNDLFYKRGDSTHKYIKIK